MRPVQPFVGSSIQVLESRILLAAPVNDTWQQATPLDPVFNVVEGSLSEAMTDGGVSGAWFAKNVWYKYVSPVNTALQYSIEGANIRLWREGGASPYREGLRGSEILVTAQQIYYVEVIPSWSSSETEFELRLNATGLGGMPNAPDQHGSTFTDNEITIRWTDWNPYTATGHEILRRFGAERTILTAESGATSFTDTGATPGMRYTYAVLTRTEAGTSVWSNSCEWGPRPVNDTPDEALELDPAGGMVSGFAMTGDAWHSWTPQYSGDVEMEPKGNGVSQYELYQRDANGVLVSLGQNDSEGVGAYSVEAGRTYWLRIMGASANGYALDLIRVGGLEGAPRMPPAPLTVVDAGAVALQWADESDNESSFILERRVNWGGWETLATLPPDTQTYLDYVPLVQPTALHYRVAAVNDLASRTSSSSPLVLFKAPNDRLDNALELSGTAIETETDLTSCTFEPGEPYYVGTGSVWYKWTAPVSGKFTWEVSDGSEPYYGPRLEPFVGDSLATLLSVGTGDRTGSKQFTAIAGKQYYLQVTGNGSKRITLRAQVAPAEPPAAVLPEIVDLASSQFQVRWADTWDDETGFVVEQFSPGQKLKDAQVYTLPANATSFTVNSRTASLRIRVTRADVDSEPIYLSHTVYVPVPRDLSAEQISGNSVGLTWKVGLPGANTEVWFRETGTAQWQQPYSGQVTTGQSYSVSVLPDRSYEFRLRSQNQLDPQEFTPVVTVRIPAAAPSTLTADPDGDAIRLEWSYLQVPPQSEVWRRALNETNQKRIGITSDLQFLDTTALIGVTYEYKVYAMTENGRGSPKTVRGRIPYPDRATVMGTEGDDEILVETAHVTYPVVWVNGVPYEQFVDGYSALLVIYGLGGNDYIGTKGGSTDRFLIVYGGDGDDTIYGSVMSDRLYGEAGNDKLYGSWSWDSLYGGDGNDYLSGGLYDDSLVGGAGNDIFSCSSSADGSDELIGGEGWDRVDYSLATEPVLLSKGGARKGGDLDVISSDIEAIYTGSGDDVIYAGSVANEIRSGAGNDLIYSSGGNDTILSGDGKDTLHGGIGNDLIDAGEGDDLLYGEDGADRLFGKGGADLLYGSAGADTLTPGLGKDIVSGGADRDLVSYSERTTALRISLDGKANDGRADEYDDVRLDIEDVRGGAGNDWIYGSELTNRFWAGRGDDTILGNGGDDTLYGEDGNDLGAGHAGKDQLIGGNGNDTLGGGAGANTLYGGAGADQLLAKNGEVDRLLRDTLDLISADVGDVLA